MNLFERPKKQQPNNGSDVVRKYMADLGCEGMQIKESMDLLQKTLNPSTYFYRARYAEELTTNHLKNPYPVWNGLNCQQLYDKLNDRFEKNTMHREFIDRLFAAGREDSLVYQMYEVGLKMSPETRIYFLKKLGGKKYHFCVVGFPETNKKYTYVTKDCSIVPGDTVTVPTGNEFAPDTKAKTVIDVFDGSLDELDFPIERLRCVEEKLKGIKCPNCGASVEVNVGEKTGKCPYCQANYYLFS